MLRIGLSKKRSKQNAQSVPEKFPKTLNGFYWAVIKKFPWFIGSMFFLTVFLDAFGLFYGPLVSKWMFYIFENALTIEVGYALQILMAVIGLYMVTNICTAILSFLSGKYQMLVNRYKMFLLYGRLYHNDTNFFVDNSAGYVLKLGQEITGNFASLTWEFWASLLGVIIGFFAVVGVLFSINIWLVVIVLGNGVLRTIWQMYMQKKISILNKESTKETAKFSGVQTDSFDNIMTVRCFGTADLENQHLWKLREPIINLRRKTEYFERWRWIPSSLVWLVLRALIIWICFVQIRDGQMTVSSAAFVWGAATSITNVFIRINKMLIKFYDVRTRAYFAWDELIQVQNVKDKPGAQQLKLSKTNADIDFDNVSFGYGDKKVLKNFNLKISHGQRIGIVGLSGAGKTTLVNLLLRLYDVNAGAVKIGGMDVRNVKQESLRKQIALVPQETELFNRSLLDNIRYAQPNASRADVIAAAKKANIHDFINKLPDGYDSLVGNRGVKLSGGQRQRIAIARAVLKKSPILILDEATSALDSQNEGLIQSALQKVMQGKTTLAIAHRLSTLRNMDSIIVIENGKIVETGSHKQLLKKNGVYKKLWSVQTNGFIG